MDDDTCQIMIWGAMRCGLPAIAGVPIEGETVAVCEHHDAALEFNGRL